MNPEILIGSEYQLFDMKVEEPETPVIDISEISNHDTPKGEVEQSKTIQAILNFNNETESDSEITVFDQNRISTARDHKSFQSDSMNDVNEYDEDELIISSETEKATFQISGSPK